MKRYLLTVCLLLSACANLPSAIKNPPAHDISYSQAVQNLAAYKNAPVRWGGIITEVENEQDFTQVQVLYYPLDSEGEPDRDKSNEGRFVFKTAQFLDPAIYTKNSEITVAGALVGDIERMVGKKVMRVPLISATTVYLWPVYEYGNYYNDFGYGYNPYYGGHPYYWGNYYWPSSTYIRRPYRVVP